MEEAIRRPRTDERALWNVVLGIVGYPAVAVAHQLGLFRVLAEEPSSLTEVASALGISARPAEAVLTVCTSLGLTRLEDGRYGLTPVSEDYLLETSPTYFGAFLDAAMIANNALYTFESVKQAVVTNAPQVYAGQDLFKSHEEQAALARAFTQMMHGHSIGPALAWPDAVDLSRNRLMLDVGGGSGAHAIGATLRWSNLQAIVFDMPPVCQVAEETTARYGVQGRVRTQVGDMWTDPFPRADVHFYADIFHDWPPEKCHALARKSFGSLEPGGRIILHEMLLADDKAGPFPAAAYNVAMLLWTQGQQFSGRELSGLLAEAGFTNLEVRPTFGYWSVVTGRRP